MEECGGFAQACRKYGGSPSTIKSAWYDRHKLPPYRQGKFVSEDPGLRVDNDDAVVIGKIGESDVDDIVTRAGLSLDEWEVERSVLNEWEAMSKDAAGEPIVTLLHQLKVFLKKKVDRSWLFPAIDVEQRWTAIRSRSREKNWLEVVCGDQQAPFHDRLLHQAFCHWLHDVKPDGITLVGDTSDFPTISRHMDNPNWAATPQECIQQSFNLLSDYRDAAPGARIRKLVGNHDWRLESELLTRAERMWGIKPAQIPGQEDEPRAMSLRRLLHLDRLGIELVGREGDHWKMAEIELADNILVRHEIPKPAGRRVQASVIGGHTHRQDIAFVSEWVRGEPVTYALMQVGCMAEPRGGLGYAKDPNWQPGFGTIVIDGDGHNHCFELAKWRSGTLVWRGDKW